MINAQGLKFYPYDKCLVLYVDVPLAFHLNLPLIYHQKFVAIVSFFSSIKENCSSCFDGLDKCFMILLFEFNYLLKNAIPH